MPGCVEGDSLLDLIVHASVQSSSCGFASNSSGNDAGNVAEGGTGSLSDGFEEENSDPFWNINKIEG